MVLILSGAFFGIDGQDQHQDAERIVGVGNVDGIGVGPIPKLFGNGSDRLIGSVEDLIVPFKPIPLHLPTVAVDGKPRLKEGEVLMNASDVLLAQIHFKGGEKVKIFCLMCPKSLPFAS